MFDQIGDFYFVRVEGVPQSARYVIRDETREGAPGIARRRMPKRPIPFQLISFCLLFDEDQAVDAEESFAAMVGSDPFQIVLSPNRVYSDIHCDAVECAPPVHGANNSGGISVFGVTNPYSGADFWTLTTTWQCIYAGVVDEDL